jgi:hypothetical protein
LHVCFAPLSVAHTERYQAVLFYLIAPYVSLRTIGTMELLARFLMMCAKGPTGYLQCNQSSDMEAEPVLSRLPLHMKEMV